MYEVELKIEITKEEKERLIKALKEVNFLPKKTVAQDDYYIEAIESPSGGYDLKRYRKEGEKVIYTEKKWESVDGSPTRREREEEVTKEFFESEIRKYPDAIKIHKERSSFYGEHEGRNIHVDMDSVKFDHSEEVRHFIEAEILVADESQVGASKEMVRSFLKIILGVSEFTESPGMFSMAFKKL